MKRLEKRLDLGLSVLVSRRSRDLFFKGLGKSWWVSVSVSSRTENRTSRSRLGLEAHGLVYIPVIYSRIPNEKMTFISQMQNMN